MSSPSAKPSSSSEPSAPAPASSVGVWAILAVAACIAGNFAIFQSRTDRLNVRNQAFVAEAAQIANALEGHAREHGGVFPPAADVQVEVTSRLPSRSWPLRRWGPGSDGAVPVALMIPDPAFKWRDESGLHPLAGALTAGRLPSLGQRGSTRLGSRVKLMPNVFFITF